MIRKPKNIDVIKRCIEQDPALTISELGLLVKLLSLSTGWVYKARGLAATTGSGRDAISANMKRLSEKGYLNYGGADVDLTPLEQIYELAENPPAESNCGGKSAIVAENPPGQVAENPTYKLDIDNNYIVDDDARARATHQPEDQVVRDVQAAIHAERLAKDYPAETETIDIIIGEIAGALATPDDEGITLNEEEDPVPAAVVKAALREISESQARSAMARYRRREKNVSAKNPYILKILFSIGQDELKRMARPQRTRKPRKSNKFNDFSQRQYDYNALERQFEELLLASQERRQPAVVSG